MQALTGGAGAAGSGGEAIVTADPADGFFVAAKAAADTWSGDRPADAAAVAAALAASQRH